VQQIRVCDTKRVLDEYSEQLKNKEEELQVRVAKFSLKEKELLCEIEKVQAHGQ
jgi:hypothetical protein